MRGESDGGGWGECKGDGDDDGVDGDVFFYKLSFLATDLILL